jgi:hypothetical protein
MIWELFGEGVANLKFFHRDGSKFTGNMGDFEKEHGELSGLLNKVTGRTIIINEHGDIAAKGEADKDFHKVF